MSTEVQDKIVNGVNVTKLSETIQNVRTDPGLADFKFRAENKWENCGYSKIKIDDFYGTRENIGRETPFHLEADEPPLLLGTDRGPNPVEFVLAGLSGCMTNTLSYYAAADGVELDGIESEFEGDIDLQGFLGTREDVPSGYQEIRAKFKVKGDLSEDKIREFVQKSPVFDTLRRPIQIKIEVEKE